MTPSEPLPAVPGENLFPFQKDDLKQMQKLANVAATHPESTTIIHAHQNYGGTVIVYTEDDEQLTIEEASERHAAAAGISVVEARALFERAVAGEQVNLRGANTPPRIGSNDAVKMFVEKMRSSSPKTIGKWDKGNPGKKRAKPSIVNRYPERTSPKKDKHRRKLLAKRLREKAKAR